MKITIITVCYNASSTIGETIKSVINQSYKNLEYIIIDGESTDGTKEIIENYKKIFPIIYISEKDNGIYDAMNKGLDLATGDYLNFMNADDYFFNNTVVEEVVPFLNKQYDIVYGNMEVRYKNFKFIKSDLLDYQNIDKIFNVLTPGGAVRISLKHSSAYQEVTKEDEFGIRTYYHYSQENIADLAKGFVFIKNDLNDLRGQKWLEILLQKPQ